MRKLVDPQTARQGIRAAIPELPAIDCPLSKCAGRVLRQSVVADRPFPPFNRATMDGYALRSAEVGEVDYFTVTAKAPAGAPAVSIGKGLGSCAEIMTGAVLPADADCVVPYESTERAENGAVRLKDPTPPAPGDCVHAVGSDYPQGRALLQPGLLIGGREIAVAASCGCASLEVSKVPAIAIAATGDELVDIEADPAPHQIRRSNDLSIETSLARLHLHAKERRHLPDEPEALRGGLTALIGNNRFVILSGGISMGKRDFIPELLEELGLACAFHGVRQKPGKPMGFWSSPECAVFALPGNPISTLTCLHHYVIPAIRHALGLRSESPPFEVVLEADLSVREDLHVFLPVRLTGGNRAQPCPPQNSGDLVRVLESHGSIEVPIGQSRAQSGKAYPFTPWH